MAHLSNSKLIQVELKCEYENFLTARLSCNRVMVFVLSVRSLVRLKMCPPQVPKISLHITTEEQYQPKSLLFISLCHLLNQLSATLSFYYYSTEHQNLGYTIHAMQCNLARSTLRYATQSVPNTPREDIPVLALFL